MASATAIGSIVVDRKARQMTIPARVHVVDRPLEYLLTARGGMKEYESLLETDATGTELNLACILLGLERDKTQEPYLQFSQKRVSGPRVDIVVARKDGDRNVQRGCGRRAVRYRPEGSRAGRVGVHRDRRSTGRTTGSRRT